MKVTNKIDIHLDDYRTIPEIVVMQCDANTRELQFSLYVEEREWQVPQTGTFAISYSKPDGTGGNYNTLPDGSPACIVSDGNTITAIMAEQVLTVPGKVPVSVSIQDGGKVLSTFTVQLNVKPKPGIGAIESENYFCLKAAVDAAVVAAQKPVHVITVHQTDGGTYEADHDMSMIKEMLNANIPFTCYWYDKNIMMHLAGFQTDVAFDFTAVADGKEYRIVITEDGVDHYVTDLANVTRVTLIPQGDGSYKTDPPFAEILAANKAGDVVFCQSGARVLPLVAASNLLCVFACVHNGVEHKVLVNPVGVEVTATPLSAGGGVTILDDGNGNVTINTTTASVTDVTE